MKMYFRKLFKKIRKLILEDTLNQIRLCNDIYFWNEQHTTNLSNYTNENIFSIHNLRFYICAGSLWWTCRNAIFIIIITHFSVKSLDSTKNRVNYQNESDPR